MKRTRRIEIFHYRQVIVSEGLPVAADPNTRRVPSDVVLQQLTGLPTPEAVDDTALVGDVIKDERFARSQRKFGRWRDLFTAPNSLNSR